jgi:hypothetical protein
MISGIEASANVDDDPKSARSRMDLENEALFFRHLNALFKKRALNFQRDKKAWLCTTIMPILVVTLGFIIFAITSASRDLTPVTLDLAAFNPDVTSSPINPIPFNSISNPYTCQPGTCSYYPVIVQDDTAEIYTFCGTQANLGVNLADLTVQTGQHLCSIDTSSDILRTLDGFQGAFATETQVETVLDVRTIPTVSTYCLIISLLTDLNSLRKVYLIRPTYTRRHNTVQFGTHESPTARLLGVRTLMVHSST